MRGLVVKLDKELSKIELDGTRINCGGGARLPAVSARAAQAGLEGLEFGVNIPGTVGGAVRMNANAYGGELARVLEWVDVVGGAGHRATHSRPSSASATARSSLAPAEVVAQACFALRRVGAPAGQGHAGRNAGTTQAGAAVGIKTFGSTFKNPDDPRAEGRTAGQLLEAAGCRGLRIGGASFSEKHANFIVNHGDATTADVVALMAEGRRRVGERFGVQLEAEVQTLGAVELPIRLGTADERSLAGSAPQRALRLALARDAARSGRTARRRRGCGCAIRRSSRSSASIVTGRERPGRGGDPRGADLRRRAA